MLHLLVLITVRLTAAIITPIADCDETFNYWEPAHFLAFDRGFQTWEYSPTYALRSYLFLLPWVSVARSVSFLVGRPTAFYVVRVAQAALSVLAEMAFVMGVSQRFGLAVGRLLLWLLIVSPGLFMASVAFLPSSAAMLLVCVVWALWLRGQLEAAIFLGACTVVVVWPFTGLLFVPLGLHALYTLGPLRGLVVAWLSFCFWAGMSVLVDMRFFGRPVLPAWEILRYNVLGGSEKGAELYGVEPWHFYFLNGLLNLTIALPVAMHQPAAAVVAKHFNFQFRVQGEAFCYCFAGFAWLVFFSSIPHKEERFLAPAFPILLLAAATVTVWVARFLEVMTRRTLRLSPPREQGLSWRNPMHLLVVAAVMLGSGALGASRIAALQTGYQAPLSVYTALSKELQARRFRSGPEGNGDPVHVCVGTEWYRFMTSFFLPHPADHLSFVTFGPTGLLPQEYSKEIGTTGIPPHMNDRNEDEPSRYVNEEQCDYLIDLDLGEVEGSLESLRAAAQSGASRRDGRQKWKVLFEAPFLDASKSRQPWRAFFVPNISPKRNVYAPYRLYGSVDVDGASPWKAP